jgi:hypothetical protein
LLNKKKLYYGNNNIDEKEMERKNGSMDAITYVRSTKNKYYPSNWEIKIDIIKNYYDKKWTLQFLDIDSIDIA